MVVSTTLSPSWRLCPAEVITSVPASAVNVELVAVVLKVHEASNDGQDGVCQVAAVLLVAVNTCPELGAVALDTLTVVVADCSAFVEVAVSPT